MRDSIPRLGVRDSIPRLAGDGVRESGDGVRESGDGVRVPAPRPRGDRGQSNLWPPLASGHCCTPRGDGPGWVFRINCFVVT